MKNNLVNYVTLKDEEITRWTNKPRKCSIYLLMMKNVSYLGLETL